MVSYPRCKRVTSRTAEYDCVNNAIVREGRVWLPKQWAPLVCAGPLTTSLRGLWVSGLLPPDNGGPTKGAATLKPPK